jgi:hypothetical protein
MTLIPVTKNIIYFLSMLCFARGARSVRVMGIFLPVRVLQFQYCWSDLDKILYRGLRWKLSGGFIFVS